MVFASRVQGDIPHEFEDMAVPVVPPEKAEKRRGIIVEPFSQHRPPWYEENLAKLAGKCNGAPLRF